MRTGDGRVIWHLLKWTFNLTVTVFGGIIGHIQRHRAQKSLRKVAQALNLELYTPRPHALGLRGTLRGQPVNVEVVPEDAQAEARLQTRLIAGHPLEAFEGTRFRPRSLMDSVININVNTVKTGLKSFDSLVIADGHAGRILRVADRSFRSRMAQLAKHNIWLIGGQAQRTEPGVITDTERLSMLLQLSARAAQKAAERAKNFPTIIRRFKTEPDAEVRERILRWTDNNGRKEEREALFDMALADADPAVRTLGFSAHPNLNTLVSVLNDSTAHREAQIQALEHINRTDPARARRMIPSLLAHNERLIRFAAAKIACEFDDPDLLEPLMALWPTNHPDVARALAYTLGEFGDSSCRPILHRMLTIEDDEVQVAALGAFAKHGLIEDVPQLSKLVTGLLALGAVPTAATRAIADIQSRVQGVVAGQLAIVEHTQGDLALVEEE